jgi:RNA polymerase-binding transcription factor DksA
MDAINNKSIVEAALCTQEKKLVGLLRVQGELGSDDFGNCRKCHKAIPIKRIVLVPHNKFCVRCAK